MTDRPLPDRPDAEALTERIREEAERTWALLVEAHDAGAWAALGYESWDAYVTAEFDAARSTAFRLLERARVLPEDDGAASEVELTETQARDVVNQVVLSLEALTMGIDLVDVSTLPKDAHAAGIVDEALDSFRRLRDALDPTGPAAGGP